ncbi:MAG: hypothetical protein GF331_04025 [Chitinivibrionales bacterium]|nr:hypothetical protein [Chitinivibrionales bacterium]
MRSRHFADPERAIHAVPYRLREYQEPRTQAQAMTVDVLLIGSGRMALDIGAYLLGRGRNVAWLSSTPERLPVIERHAAKTMRRLARVAPEEDRKASYRVHALGGEDIPSADCVIEATAESLPKKQRDLGAVAARCEGALLLSNSSSLLPSRIHPRCVGLHFFYPVSLTGVVELVLPDGSNARERVERFAAANGLRMVVEDERSAFAANRMLVPLQAECMRALRDGAPAEVVDECSAVAEMAVGQLKLMDTVGIETILTSVKNYARLTGPIDAADVSVLEECLRELARATRDASSGPSLLSDGVLPWQSSSCSDTSREMLCTRFAAVYANTVLRYEEHGLMRRADLDVIVSAVHGAADSVDELIRRLGPESIRAQLQQLHRGEARSYFQPSRLLELWEPDKQH